MRPRLRTPSLGFASFVPRAAALAMGVFAVVGGAGPLDPPPGPVASTSKPLADIEPRVAVNQMNTPGDASAVYVISQPGSYYLTGNITATGALTGVRISASDVTLDLAGFHIAGNSTGFAGVRVVSSMDRCVVRNGSITGFIASGIALGHDAVAEDLRIAGCGVGVDGEMGCTVRRVSIGATTTGYAIDVAGNAVIESCSITDSPRGISVSANSVVRDCSVSSATDVAVNLAGGLCHVTNNRLRGSPTGIASGRGIISPSFGSRIDFNHLTFFDVGVELAGSTNLVVRNSFARTNTAVNAPTSVVGPLVTSANIAVSSNPHANYDH